MYVCSGFLISWAFWVAQLSRNSSPGSLIKRGHCVFFPCLLPHILQSLSSSCNPIPIPNTNTKLRTSTSTIKPLLYQTKIPHCDISRTIYLIPLPLLLPFVFSYTTKTSYILTQPKLIAQVSRPQPQLDIPAHKPSIPRVYTHHTLPPLSFYSDSPCFRRRRMGFGRRCGREQAQRR
jgi:hypothetical protein